MSVRRLFKQSYLMKLFYAEIRLSVDFEVYVNGREWPAAPFARIASSITSGSPMFWLYPALVTFHFPVSQANVLY